MRYLGVDRWSTSDYDIGRYVFHFLNEKKPLPELIQRDKQEISYHIYENHKEAGRIIYHGEKSWGQWDERDHMWVYIDEPETKEVIFEAVNVILEMRCLRKAEKEALKKMKISIMKQELNDSGLEFIEDNVERYVNERERKQNT